METFTEDTFEFRKARIVGGDERAEVGVMGGLRGLDGLRVEGTGNLFGILTQFTFPGLPYIIFTRHLKTNKEY